AVCLPWPPPSGEIGAAAAPAPALAWRPGWSAASVATDRAGADCNAELEQLATDPLGATVRVLAPDGRDYLADLDVQRGCPDAASVYWKAMSRSGPVRVALPGCAQPTDRLNGPVLPPWLHPASLAQLRRSAIRLYEEASRRAATSSTMSAKLRTSRPVSRSTCPSR